jgi:hypothetical protein
MGAKAAQNRHGHLALLEVVPRPYAASVCVIVAAQA